MAATACSAAILSLLMSLRVVPQIAINTIVATSRNSGRGLLMTGAREWRNYKVTTTLTPHLVTASGVAVRVQGLRRYYALLQCTEGGKHKIKLVKVLDQEHILAQCDYAWEFGTGYELSLAVKSLPHGEQLVARINGAVVFEVVDEELLLEIQGLEQATSCRLFTFT